MSVFRHFVLVSFALAIAAPALAGGPLEAPDDGGPGGDYTGWTPVAFIFGGIDTATSTVRVACMNVGQVETNAVVQFYDAGDNPTRQPDEEDNLTMPPSDVDTATTAGTNNGTMTARVLVEQKKAAKSVQCSGVQLDGGIPVAGLEVVYIKKAPKIKVAKK